MAVIWKQQSDGRNFEVRTAGKAKRLYTNGVFNSQYNPNNLITHAVWDLLSIPALLPHPKPPERVLVLGVGGGTVFHQLDAWAGPSSITGVELCATHIQIAKKFFDLNKPHHTLIHGDAIEYVKNYRGAKFDLIIEDLYIEGDTEAHRATPANSQWMKKLGQLLTSQGVLVMNFYSKADLDKCSYRQSSSLQKRFPTALQLTTKRYDNRVLAFTKITTSPASLRQNLQQVKVLRKINKKLKLSYNCRNY